MDFSFFYKTSYVDGGISNERYDLFFSAYDDCERTNHIYNKIWILFPHYELNLTDANIYKCNSYKEDECFVDLLAQIEVRSDLRIAIDVTGFIRPHLIYFIIALNRIGINLIDLYYSEPQHYKDAEDTNFSGFIDEVKLVEGCGALINYPQTENDLLIVTAGYDDKLLAKVAQTRSKIKSKYFILGLPSLQPDMYQESILKLYNAKETVGAIIEKYSPAFDPFVTAQTISDIVKENPHHSNIYLSPLSTKPQALGVALYYIWNYQKLPVNIVYPYSKVYKSNTAFGIKKTWRYTFELPIFTL
jgi:hypothetical protein